MNKIESVSGLNHEIKVVDDRPSPWKSMAEIIGAVARTILAGPIATLHLVHQGVSLALNCGLAVLFIPFGLFAESARKAFKGNISEAIDRIKNIFITVIGLPFSPILTVAAYVQNAISEKGQNYFFKQCAELGLAPTLSPTIQATNFFENTNADNLPSFLQGRDAQIVVTRFYAKLGETIGEKELKLVKKGDQIIQQIQKNEFSIPTDKLEKQQSLRALMWYFDMKAAAQYAGFERGMHCVCDPNGMFHKLLVGLAGQDAYPRASSHFKEQTKNSIQYGIDIPEGLPHGLRTILFGRRKDAPITFFKIESDGVAAFSTQFSYAVAHWTVNQIGEGLLHGIGFIRSIYQRCVGKANRRDERKEHVTASLRQSYVKQTGVPPKGIGFTDMQSQVPFNENHRICQLAEVDKTNAIPEEYKRIGEEFIHPDLLQTRNDSSEGTLLASNTHQEALG